MDDLSKPLIEILGDDEDGQRTFEIQCYEINSWSSSKKNEIILKNSTNQQLKVEVKYPGLEYDKDQQKPSATLVISGDIFKIYFDENVDLNLIKENLLKRQNKYQEEMDKISQRLSNKGFTDRAPKNIVEQEKTNYSNLKDDIKKISLTIESL